jgi:hypothetical protein
MGSKWILGRLPGRVWNEFTWLRAATGGVGSCEHSDEPSGSATRKLIREERKQRLKYMCMHNNDRKYINWIEIHYIIFLNEKISR